MTDYAGMRDYYLYKLGEAMRARDWPAVAFFARRLRVMLDAMGP